MDAQTERLVEFMVNKFKDGDQVQMSEEAIAQNLGARSRTGVVVRYSSRDPDGFMVRIKRDGMKTIETWHENAWELRSAAEVKR